MIRIGYDRSGDTLVLTVTDNGPGIDLAREQEYFQPFMTTREGAIGLGLTAARALVQTSGGTLRFIGPSAVEVRVPSR